MRTLLLALGLVVALTACGQPESSGRGGAEDIQTGPVTFTREHVRAARLTKSLIVSDTSIAAEWRVQARHSADLTVGWALIEATGQSVSLEGALTGHLVANAEGGTRPYVFDDLHLHYDTTSLLVQLALT